jgi:hypothetical protein
MLINIIFLQRIDHLEVDKNQILNRTQRKIDSKLTLNGIDYFLRYVL